MDIPTDVIAVKSISFKHFMFLVYVLPTSDERNLIQLAGTKWARQ